MKQLKLNKKCTTDKLESFGFKKYGTNYKMFVPLYKNKDTDETLIEAEILISLTENYVGYDVLDVCNNTLYAAFYNKEFSYNNIVLNIVLSNMAKFFVKMNESNITC